MRHSPPPLNTLEEAIAFAQALSRELAGRQGKTWRNYQVFAAFTRNEREALAAFVAWRARGGVQASASAVLQHHDMTIL